MALRDLADLRQDTAEMCQDLARIELAAARGTPFPLTLAEVVSAHPLSCSRDGLDQARETLASARGAGRVARLASLRDFLVRARALELEPGAAQEAWELPRRPSVLLPGDPGLHGALPPVAVERDLPFVREREQRAAMESALAAVWRSAVSVQTALWEAAREALSELELGEPARAALALHERGWPAPRRAEPAEPVPPAIPAARPAEIKDSALVRAPPPPLPVQDAVTEACESFLRDTEPLALDLGSWLLERHTGARAGGAERHDLLHFLHAPRFSGAFPRGELVRTVRRWAETLRLDLTAGGAISLEEEERALQPAGPPEDAPPEDLWFGDAGLLPACGALLEGLLLDSAFLRRCARAELPRDDERALGVAALLDARLDAARALGALLALQGLWSRGGRPTLAELWEDTGGKPSLQALTAELFRACE